MLAVIVAIVHVNYRARPLTTIHYPLSTIPVAGAWRRTHLPARRTASSFGNCKWSRRMLHFIPKTRRELRRQPFQRPNYCRRFRMQRFLCPPADPCCYNAMRWQTLCQLCGSLRPPTPSDATPTHDRNC